tara:strand:+ start:316 stop:678 length:363 start_codon:yes stop_codon:yes gene_type:complete
MPTQADNLKASLPLIKEISKLDGGFEYLTKSLNLCEAPTDVDDVMGWVQAPWFDVAEGNFPFASSYITFAVGPGIYDLPPWPMTVASSYLGLDFKVVLSGSPKTVAFDVNVNGKKVSERA